MIVYQKATNYDEANRIKDFITHHGYGAMVKRNRGFMSEKYPHKVVGNDEEVLDLVERNERIENVMTGEEIRKATWNRPKKFWDDSPKSVRS